MSDNVSGLFEAAVAKDKSGEGGEALRLLDALLEYQADHRLGLFYRGGIKIRYRKDFESALKDWEQAFDGAPPAAAARVQELYPLLVESCMERLLQNTSLDPHNAVFHSAFGRACFIFGQLDHAERHLRRALQLEASRAIDGIRLYEVLLKRGKRSEAAEALQKQAEASPEDPDVHAILGAIHRDGNRTAQAIKHLEQAATLNPRLFATRQSLGDIYLQQGRVEQAEGHFRFLLANSASAAAHLGMAECDKQQFRFEEALDNFRKAVRLEPRNVRALAALGEMALQFGSLELGVHSLQAALEIEPARPDIYGLLAKAAAQKGDAAGAIRALRLQLQHDPNDGYASYTLASHLRSQGEFEESAQLLRRSLQSRSGDVQVCLDLADCYLKLQRQAEALEVLQEAYQRNPTREELQAALARFGT
jgi:tetratricopeptide (TPR) repeat protein